MAHFRGTVKGGRGMASRLGHKTTGLSVTARSWSGEVRVNLYFDKKSGEDHARIDVYGRNGGHVKTLYHGPIERTET